MEIIKAVSTKLSDRTLWYDGDSSIPESQILDSIAKGISVSGLFVENVTDDIKQYNTFVKPSEQITVKSTVQLDPIVWVLPEPYDELDPVEYVLDAANKIARDDQYIGRLQRVADEIELYQDLHLMEVLKVLIYIINTLHTNQVVWGVGRGSSVSSYLLYLIGVHDVDSYAYDLQITDFLH